MKELSIEQKAKAYDDVVSKLGRFMAQGVNPLITRADVQDFFPELAESEDDKIRAFLVDFIKVCKWTEKEDQGWPTKDACVAWLEKQGEQKPADWSEEDENNILFLTSIIEECFKDKEKITLCGDTVCANFTKEDVINRLKSLKDRYTWKPSEEQMSALSKAIAFVFDSNSDVKHSLESLYNELKKL